MLQTLSVFLTCHDKINKVIYELLSKITMKLSANVFFFFFQLNFSNRYNTLSVQSIKKCARLIFFSLKYLNKNIHLVYNIFL